MDYRFVCHLDSSGPYSRYRVCLLPDEGRSWGDWIATVRRTDDGWVIDDPKDYGDAVYPTRREAIAYVLNGATHADTD